MKNFTKKHSRYIVLALSLILAVIIFAKPAKADTFVYNAHSGTSTLTTSAGVVTTATLTNKPFSCSYGGGKWRWWLHLYLCSRT